MDGTYGRNPNKYFVTILIAIILLEFIIIMSQSIGHFMQGYLNPGEISFTTSEEIDFTSTIDNLEQQIEDLEKKNLLLEAKVSSLNNQIKQLSSKTSPTPVPR